MRAIGVIILSLAGLAAWVAAIDRYPFGLDQAGRARRRRASFEEVAAGLGWDRVEPLAMVRAVRATLPRAFKGDEPEAHLEGVRAVSVPRSLVLVLGERQLAVCTPHRLGVRLVHAVPVDAITGFSLGVLAYQMLTVLPGENSEPSTTSTELLSGDMLLDAAVPSGVVARRHAATGRRLQIFFVDGSVLDCLAFFDDDPQGFLDVAEGLL